VARGEFEKRSGIYSNVPSAGFEPRPFAKLCPFQSFARLSPFTSLASLARLSPFKVPLAPPLVSFALSNHGREFAATSSVSATRNTGTHDAVTSNARFAIESRFKSQEEEELEKKIKEWGID
jgi:hypothetical protein